MGSAVKNVSALLSPRFLSPFRPSRNLLGAPKSEGKVIFCQSKRPNVVKKLNFSENTKSATNLTQQKNKDILPKIRIDHVQEKLPKISLGENIININTPNKFKLVKDGFETFKRTTTVLGKGTFGTVFRGNYKENKVAVKLVSKKNGLREKNALNLRHKNITQILEIIHYPDYDNCLIIMENLENCRDLQNIIDNFEFIYPQLPGKNYQKVLKKFCLEITSGLDHCHKNGILHLDLKPKNILVTTEGTCKICDFGNSVTVKENLEFFTHYGTAIYTAPEVLLGKKPSIKSDVYSLGLIFWQIKYKKSPFQNFTCNESVIYNVGKHNVRPSYDTFTAFTELFTKCWDRDPKLRPSTGEILKVLEDANFYC